MTDKEQIIIDGKKQYCKILFRCKHIDDTAAYDMMCEGIEIKPENAPVSDFELMLIENTNSPFGFSLICKRNNKEDVWEHSGFGNSGACSIVTALLKQLTCKSQECEAADYDYQKQLENTNKWIAECENLQQQLDQLRGENEELKKRLIQKDEVNMEHKPIYLDGVDVSGCSYGEIEKDILKCSCEYNVRSASMFCKDNPKCYYKQLKRKEKEYEELRQYHNKCCEEFEKEKQNLIDRYNQFSKDFFIGKYCKKEYCDLLKAKEQECEELKEKNALLESQMAFNLSEVEIKLGNEINRSETLLKELKRFDKIKDEFREISEKLKSENDRYRKALEEIEKEIRDFQCDNCEDYHCETCDMKDILDIINEVKGEENA